MDIESIKKKVLEDVDPELRQRRLKERRQQRIIVTLQFLVLIVLIMLLFYMMMGISTVEGDSMYPTLHDKDIVLYFRKTGEYKQGDVIVLRRPNGEEFVKRIVAVAGDTVNIQGGVVYVNGKEENAGGSIGNSMLESEDVEYPLTVSDKEVFVLGDNREVSADSREFGTVSVRDIKGKIAWYIGKP